MDFVTREFFSIFYSEGSKGKIFRFFINHRDTLDKIKGDTSFSSYLIKAVIKKEELLDKLYRGGRIIQKNPNWRSFEENINRKYNEQYTNELVMAAKMEFYYKIKNYKQYANVLDKQIEKKYNQLGKVTKFLYVDADPYHISDAWALNSAAWNLFLRCENRNELLIALRWIDLSIRLDQPDPNVQYLDTKANLLYKLGCINEAIDLENMAVEIDNENAVRNGEVRGVFHDEYTSTVAKMKMRQPTWPNESSDLMQ